MDREIKTVKLMIEIFCRGHHRPAGVLCPECGALLDYASERLKKCPLLENKPKCSRCPVHCYKPDMQAKIREVMKYSGPRMLWRHPVLSGTHFLLKSPKPVSRPAK